jgi:peptidoglycan LD-endopeptidase CwlK
MFNNMKGWGKNMPEPTISLGSTGDYVRLLQMNLNGLALNYNNFAIDGNYDEKTMVVVRDFQDRFQMESNGVVDAHTWSVLNEQVKLVQKQLNINDYNVGYPDGWYNASTTSAVQRFQQSNGLQPLGIFDPRTRRKLFNPHPRDNIDQRPS